MSHHNERRKRPLEEDPEDDNNKSVSPSPLKVTDNLILPISMS